jgi:glutathione S-transferase
MFLRPERLPFMRRSTLFIESTQGCGQTPHLLVLLEELGAPYELLLRPDGYFISTYARPGPRLVDDDLSLFELAAMLRHCARTRAEGRLLPRSPQALARVDAWLELAGFLALAVQALRREEREQGEGRRPPRIAEERAKISSILELLERALDDSDGDWVLGDFGLVDCALVTLPKLARIVDLAGWPRVRAYSERLLTRPAVGRVLLLTRFSPTACAEPSSCSVS